MTDTVRFEVPGSSGEIYNVVATRDESKFKISCTCQAGQNRMHCRHRTMLLNGDGSDVPNLNESDLKRLLTMYDGTELSRQAAVCEKVDDLAKMAKDASAAEKKKFGRLMEGGSAK
jgi:hypothetical protein